MEEEKRELLGDFDTLKFFLQQNADKCCKIKKNNSKEEGK